MKFCVDCVNAECCSLNVHCVNAEWWSVHISIVNQCETWRTMIECKYLGKFVKIIQNLGNSLNCFMQKRDFNYLFQIIRQRWLWYNKVLDIIFHLSTKFLYVFVKCISFLFVCPKIDQSKKPHLHLYCYKSRPCAGLHNLSSLTDVMALFTQAGHGSGPIFLFCVGAVSLNHSFEPFHHNWLWTETVFSNQTTWSPIGMDMIWKLYCRIVALILFSRSCIVPKERKI